MKEHWKRPDFTMISELDIFAEILQKFLLNECGAFSN